MIYKPITNAKCQTLISRLGLSSHFVFALIWALFLVPVTYADIVVTSNSSSGAGSLPQAITDIPAGETITFHSDLDGETIIVTSTLTISKNLTIDASALTSGITISGDNANVRIFTINNTATDVKLKGLTITGSNQTHGKGTIYNAASKLTITNCTITGNSTNNGGAIYNQNNTLIINNSTITNNNAKSGGGGIYRNNGTVNIKNSIIAGNKKNGSTTDANADCFGTITSDEGYNLVGTGTGCPQTNSDPTDPTDDPTNKQVAPADVFGKIFKDTTLVDGILPLIGTPGDNPAIDGGNGCEAKDQLGTERPQPEGGECDIGAHEYKAPFDPEPTAHPTSFTTATVDSDEQITLTWTDVSAEPVPSGYLIKLSNTSFDAITAPTDTNAVADGSGAKNITQGTQTYQWTGLTAETTYYFKIYPYTNADELIDFKTDGTVPEDSETTLASEPTNHPADFSATKTDTTITLTWTGSIGTQLPAKYLIVGKTGSGTFTDPADKTAVADDTNWDGDSVAVNVDHATGSNTYSFSGLTPETQYDFQIYPYTNTDANIDFKTDETIPSVSQTTKATDPEPTHHATGFAATVNSDSILTLTWTDATAGDGEQAPSGYLIKLSNTSFDAITVPTDLNVVADDIDVSDGSGAINITQGTQTYQWTGLTAETTYYFKLYPYTNAAATIDYKTDGDIPQIEKLTHVSIPEPTKNVTDFTATAENNSIIKLTWTGSTGDQVPANYLIVAKTGGGSYAAVNDGTPVTDNTDWAGESVAVNVNHAEGENTYTFTGLTPETDYDFQIYPYTNADTTIDYKIDGVPPASATTPASGFTAKADSDTTITLSWTDSTGDPLPFGYLIKTSATSFDAITAPTDGTPVDDDTTVSDGSGAKNIRQGVGTYQWTGFSAPNTYYFKNYPYSNSGSTINYKTDSVEQVSVIMPPKAPNGLSAGATSGSQININWTDVSDDETGFKIYRSDDGGKTWGEEPIATLDAGANQYVSGGLTCAKTYHYKVSAYNDNGEGYTIVSAGTHPCPVPPPPAPPPSPPPSSGGGPSGGSSPPVITSTQKLIINFSGKGKGTVSSNIEAKETNCDDDKCTYTYPLASYQIKTQHTAIGLGLWIAETMLLKRIRVRVKPKSF